MNIFKKRFKLTNYCVQYYLHKYYSAYYLTDEEWFNVLEKKEVFSPKIRIGQTSVLLSRGNVINQLFLTFINFDLQRFKSILKQCNNFFPMRISLNGLLYVDLIKLMLSIYQFDKKDYIPIKKIGNEINFKFFKACLYHLSFLYDKNKHEFKTDMYQDFNKDKFVVVLLQHYINIDFKYYHSDVYITNNYTKDEKQINKLLLILYEKSLESNSINYDLLYSFIKLCKKLKLREIKYINNIYNFLNKNFLHKDRIDIKSFLLIQKLLILNFSEEQKTEIQCFVNRINANLFLTKL